MKKKILLYIFLLLASILNGQSFNKKDISLNSNILAGALSFLILDNFTANFWKYPYYDNVDEYVLTRDSVFYNDDNSKVFRYTFDSSFLYLKNFGIGNETRFESIFFHFFGFIFENSIYNSSEQFKNLKLGTQISLIQNTFLSIYLDLFWTKYYGKRYFNIDDGIAIGFIARSFPVKPFSIEWKFVSSLYEDILEINESNLQFGILYERLEFFLAWKSIQILNYEDDKKIKSLNGISTGIRFYF